MNEIPTAPQRPWYRFSLKWLLVLVTLSAIPAGWAAYQLNWIRQRQAFLTLERELGNEATVYNRNPYPIEPPGWLGLFGERGADEVCVRIAHNKADEPQSETDTARLRLAEELFPESNIFAWSFSEEQRPANK